MLVKCSHVQNGEKHVKPQDAIAHIRFHETSHEFECLVAKFFGVQRPQSEFVTYNGNENSVDGTMIPSILSRMQQVHDSRLHRQEGRSKKEEAKVGYQEMDKQGGIRTSTGARRTVEDDGVECAR